jgi:hypothetical protein
VRKVCYSLAEPYIRCVYLNLFGWRGREVYETFGKEGASYKSLENSCVGNVSVTNSVTPEPEVSSPCSQEPATGPCPEPIESIPHAQPIFLRSILIPSSHLRLGLPSVSFLQTFAPKPLRSSILSHASHMSLHLYIKTIVFRIESLRFGSSKFDNSNTLASAACHSHCYTTKGSTEPHLTGRYVWDINYLTSPG